MRIARTFGLAVVAAAALPALVAAQSTAAAPRSFEDSWYWGVKGGITSFTTGPQGTTKVTAPTGGAEWLITASRVGLYLSVQQSFFDEQAGVYDPSSAGSVRTVDISDLRSYGASLFAFPVKWGALRPYAGVGVSINVIQSAAPTGTFDSPERQDSVFTRVDDQSSRASLIWTAGLQANASRWGLFVQASAMPTRNNFLINGAANTYQFEGGLRFNLASAVERLK
jgi:hypothetical protein